MNINEDGHQPHGWHSLDGDRCIKRDTPTLLNKDFKIYNIHLPPLKSKKFGKYYNDGNKKHFIHNIPKGEGRKSL